MKRIAIAFCIICFSALAVLSMKTAVPAQFLGKWKVVGYKCDSSGQCEKNKKNDIVVIGREKITLHTGKVLRYRSIGTDAIFIEDDEFTMRLTFREIKPTYMHVTLLQKIHSSHNDLDVVAQDEERWEKISGITDGSNTDSGKNARRGRDDFLIGIWDLTGKNCDANGCCNRKNTVAGSFHFRNRDTCIAIDKSGKVEFKYTVKNERLVLETERDGKTFRLSFAVIILNDREILLKADRFLADSMVKSLDGKLYERYERRGE